ncbi:MAG: hypothetical protein HY075_01355, partial [Deltaproteobacteria bacterium]|nr:hypothetical protein [Deltaproteobacteria bacterium]
MWTKTIFFAVAAATAAFQPMTTTPALAADPSGVYLGDIPASEYPPDANRRFEQRGQRILEFMAKTPQPPWGPGHGVDFWETTIAKLAVGRAADVEAANRVFLGPNVGVFGKVGSDFHDVFFCQRTGDYDFLLRGLVELFYHFGDNPKLIWPETRAKLITLLSQRGNQVLTRVGFGLCGTYDETENHVLQTEVSRYLTNQILVREDVKRGRYDATVDNEANGMNRWMLFHLQQFFKNDFSEYNSRPYQAYTVLAIQTLYEFAADRRVKLAAEMLLNYLDARFAVGSNNLRHYVPFRRQPGYKDRTDLLQIDDESQRFILMAGNTQLFDELPNPGWLDFGFSRLEQPALGKYRTPELILDVAMNKTHNVYFQAFRHKGFEAFASSPNFLITAGGISLKIWRWWTNQMYGWAVPTTLMPTLGGLDAKSFIRIEGHQDDMKRANTCVAPGFACGLNPVVPASIPASCLSHEDGAWTFVDFTDERCPLHYGFYAAIYSAPCDTQRCRDGGGRFGFFEAAEPYHALTFGEFRNRVLANNGGREFRSERENEYVTSDGRSIRF